MAELTTLARPYAKAAFEFALAANDLAGWSTQLATLSAVTGEEKVQALLNSPASTSQEQAQALINICGDELSESAQNYVNILAENKRLALLPEIFQLYTELKAAQENSVDVEITSAFAIDDAAEANLAQVLTKTLNQQVKLQTVVDNSLIGGVVIRAGDTVIDSSVSGKLAKLAERLAS